MRGPRAKAFCVFRHGDRILASHVQDSDEKGWRPLGGSIEFGETARDALDYVEAGIGEGLAVWKRLEEFEAPGAQPLFPEGLLDLLRSSGRPG